MAHIVIDAREYTSTTGRYMYRLLENLEKLPTEHHFSVLLKPGDVDKANFSNPNFTKIACPYKEFTFDEQFGLLGQINNLKPDLVHFGMVQQPVLYKGKVVTTMHDLTTIRFNNPDKNWLVYWLKQQVYKWVNIRVARKSDAIIVPSEFVKHDVASYTGADEAKVSVTYEAADAIAEAAQPIPELQDKQFLMYLGRPTPHKNLERLIAAFQKLQASQPDLWLVLAGKKDANYLRIEKMVQSRGIERVYFTDFVSEGQLKWLYERCRAYVFPSLSEGFGLPGLEAMAHGAPVVSSNATCLPEIYGDGAEYFDPTDISKMAAAIERVLSDDALRTKLIAKGTARVASYSWRRMAEETLSIYQKVLAD